MNCNDFIRRYVKAESPSDYIKCFIAKVLGAKVVTPLGRIKLLPNDYYDMAISLGVTVAE